MPDTGFAQQLQGNSFWGNNQKEDILTEAERYPLMNDLWENKIPRFDQITVPAYVVASYSNTLHTAGTFRAWRRMASQEKWLRIHWMHDRNVQQSTIDWRFTTPKLVSNSNDSTRRSCHDGPLEVIVSRYP